MKAVSLRSRSDIKGLLSRIHELGWYLLIRYIVVEHMEAEVSRWLLAEYREVIRVANKSGFHVVFTNVKDYALRALLEKWGAEVRSEEAFMLFDTVYTIVLDPQAPTKLRPWEASLTKFLVVGGILGDHPPRGRTYAISSKFTSSAKRNIGPYQFSIDGAVKMFLRIASGSELEDIPIAGPPVTFKIKTPLGAIEVSLPFAYPLRSNGEPDVPVEIKNLLSRGLMWEYLEESI